MVIVSGMIFNLSLHNKIVLWTTAVLGVILFLVCGASILLTRAKLANELDRDLVTEATSVLRSLWLENNQLKINQSIEWEEEHHQKATDDPIYILVLNHDRSELTRSRNLTGKQVPIEKLEFHPKEFRLQNNLLPPKKMRYLTIPVTISGESYGWLILAKSFTEIRHMTLLLLRIYGIAFPVSLILIFSGGSIIATRALKPIRKISATAREIHYSNLDQKLPVPESDDEIAHLATTLNNLLRRLQESFSTIRNFTMNASHELRTPLAVIQTELETFEQDSTPATVEYRQRIRRELNRMTKTIDDLSTLAKLDSQELVIHRETVWLNDLIFEELKRYREIAGQKEIQLSPREIDSIAVEGDAYLLRTVIANLLDNAIKFSPSKSTITVGLDKLKDEIVRLWVRDQGPGVEVHDLKLLTRRFYRQERTSITPGSGLGLSIVDWIVEKHGGKLHFQNNKDSGLTVMVELKVA
ncbi:MAG: ATP-binding protein [Fidelibacterota bacterium]